ncbi:GAF domain-containing protein, partial [Aduncisulcus paluster]
MVAYPDKDWKLTGTDLKLPMAVSYPDKTDYMASLSPIYGNNDLQLVVAAAAPMSDVTGHISRMSTRIMYSSAILLLVLFFASVYIARKGTRVMSVLLREAKKVQNFDFSDSPSLNSRIKEL